MDKNTNRQNNDGYTNREYRRGGQQSGGNYGTRSNVNRSSVNRSFSDSNSGRVVNDDVNWNYSVKDNSSNNAVKSGTKKKLIIAGVSVLAVLLLLVSIVVGAVSCIFGKIDFMSGDDLVIPDGLDSIVLSDTDVTSASDTLDDSQMQEMDASVKESVIDADGLRYEEGVTNILVLGVDARSAATKRSRSDVIIILSINENSKKIVLSSIMRDTYVAIPGRTGNDKINAASAYGGPALTVETVEGAFGIKIDHFVLVNFYSFMDIVDALGGVEVEINKSERDVLNDYVEEINRVNGHAPDNGKLYTTGDSVLLTGKQAMGYVRNRYSGNGDYERTARQREVLEKVIVKARQANYSTLLSIVDKVASNVSTDYSMTEITKLAMNAANYTDYDISQVRVPVEGSYWGGIYKGIWILDIDFEANRQALYEAIFDNYN